MFLGILLGSITYMIFLSSYVIKINVKIITYIKSILKKFFDILIFPFSLIYKSLKKIFFKPINIFIINIRKISTSLTNKSIFMSKKDKKNCKKIKSQEGF